MQETEHCNCKVAKALDSAPGNADRKSGAPLPPQTYDRAKQTISINNQD